MNITQQAAGCSSRLRRSDPNRWWARVFGGMFLAGAATHVILVTTRPSSYGSFADGSWWPFIAHTWRSVLLPNVHVLIPLLVIYEAAVGLLILSRAHRRAGIAAAIAFNAALILFGWGFCLWSVPVIVLLLRFWYLESAPRHTSDQKPAGHVPDPLSRASPGDVRPAGPAFGDGIAPTLGTPAEPAARSTSAACDNGEADMAMSPGRDKAG
jgi:hypothetical protein